MAIFACSSLALTVLWWWIQGSIPPLDGRIPLPGLRGSVNVRFDTFAVPHVYAPDQTRMHGGRSGISRHGIGCGRWSCTGAQRPGGFRSCWATRQCAIDQRFLTLGLRQMADAEWRRTPPNIRTRVREVTPRGSTPRCRSLADASDRAPVDGAAAGTLDTGRLPRHQQVVFVAAWREPQGRALAILTRPGTWPSRCRPVSGRAGLGALLDVWGERGQRTGRARRQRGTGAGQRGIRPTCPGLEWLSPDAHAMSNSWVVHGSRTASGRPILANDPHLR